MPGPAEHRKPAGLPMPAWWRWVLDVCLFPWVGPAVAYLTSSGEVDPLSVLLGIVIWPVVFVLLEMRRIRGRKRRIEQACPAGAAPGDLLTYFVVANASLVAYFLVMVLVTIGAAFLGEGEGGAGNLVVLGAILAGVYVLFLSLNAFAFHRLRRAVRLVNEYWRAWDSGAGYGLA